MDLPFPKNDFQSAASPATVLATPTGNPPMRNAIYNRLIVTRNERNEKRLKKEKKML